MRISPRRLWPIAILAATLALLVLFWNAPWPELAGALAGARPEWLALALVANLCIYPLWIWQWQLLARGQQDVSWGRMASIVALSSLANVALVKLAGAASSVLLLMGRGQLTLLGASSVLLLDQLLVGMVKVMLIFLLVAVAPLPPEVAASGIGLGLIVAVVTLGVAALVLQPQGLERATRSRHGWVRAVSRWLRSAAGALQGVRQPRLLALTLALAIGKKGAEVLAAYAVQAACGLDASWLGAFLVVGAVSITTAVPVVPGSIGVYSATVYAVYAFLGQPTGPSIAAALLLHVTELLPAICLGYATLLFSRRPSGAGPA